MNSYQPRVSILMNCHNGERYLEEALQSILSQTYPYWNLVFWDNQSTDRSAEIVKSFEDSRIKYLLSTEFTSLGKARSLAWPYLTGDLIAFLDADDVWRANKLEKQVPYFEDQEIGLVISNTEFFNDAVSRPLFTTKYPQSGYVFDRLILDYFISLETLVLRRKAIEDLPYAFDQDFSFIADFDVCLRVADNWKLSYVPEVLGGWRVHNSSDSWKSPISFADEKIKWIEKQSHLNPSLVKRREDSFSKLVVQTHQVAAMYQIADRKRKLALDHIRKAGLLNLKTVILFLFAFMPGGGKFIRLREKNKINLR